MASQKMYNPEVNFFQKAPTSAAYLENGRDEKRVLCFTHFTPCVV